MTWQKPSGEERSTRHGELELAQRVLIFRNTINRACCHFSQIEDLYQKRRDTQEPDSRGFEGGFTTIVEKSSLISLFISFLLNLCKATMKMSS
ncbi:hypothetical protein QL285_066736 [Trifolium repens]|nr:hypothetical protein QL285_066736 [Trifolium repens]